MPVKMFAISLVLLPFLTSFVSGAPAPVKKASTNPDGFIKNWVLLGPFPNPEIKPESRDRGAFDVDYLQSIGGETKAKITPGTTVTCKGPKGETVQVSAKSVITSGVILDFCSHYKDTDHKLGYIYTELNLSSDQEALFLMGSDDGAKVWVNGKLAYDIFTARGCSVRQDRFTAKLKKGTNTILAKVENGVGGWQFVLEAYVGQKAKAVDAEMKRETARREFQRQEIGLSRLWPGYVFLPGETPKIIWRDVEAVRALVGEVPLKIRWFDAGLNEVKAPEKPGRYAAYIEGKLKDGTPVRRALSFFCAPPDLNIWSDWGLKVPYLGKPIDEVAWMEQSATVERLAGQLYRESLLLTQTGAVFLASMCEARATGAPGGYTESPEVRNDEFQLALKLKLLNRADKVRALAEPKIRDGNPAPVLRKGTLEEAGFKPDAKEKIDALCRQWAEESKEPFAVLVARNGVIVTFEAFGKKPDGTPVTPGYRCEVASITKAVTGMLFGRFVDQGYTAIDDPIGKYVPDFPTTGPKKLTFRHLFTHTCSFEGHGEWGGMHNPYLDNVALNGLDYVHPGKTHIYNGMGYDLAGKAMEYMSGKSIFRLMNEDLFKPLGINEIVVYDCAYGAQLTARELGVLGQMICNRGSYGNKQLMSEETFNKLLPEPLGKYYPGLEQRWGIGLTWMDELRPDANMDSKDPADRFYPVIGHGSATSCILRVDLDKKLVIAQVRKTGGPKYSEFADRFFKTIREAMVE